MTTCPAYNGQYQDLHDIAEAKGRPCDACQPVRISDSERRREDRRIARAARR